MFYATWFGMNAQITDEYLVSLRLLQDMVNYAAEVARDTWLTIAWLAGNGDRQFFHIKADSKMLSKRQGLPTSSVADNVQDLKKYKVLMRPVGPQLIGTPRRGMRIESTNKTVDTTENETVATKEGKTADTKESASTGRGRSSVAATKEGE